MNLQELKFMQNRLFRQETKGQSSEVNSAEDNSSPLIDHCVYMQRSFSGVKFSKCFVYELVNCSNIH